MNFLKSLLDYGYDVAAGYGNFDFAKGPNIWRSTVDVYSELGVKLN